MKYLNPTTTIAEGWDGISNEGHGIAITIEGWDL